jgi:hypothetical protein
MSSDVVSFGWLQASVGKVSFTSDLWSDRQRRSYMCITAHWIARSKRSHSLELKSALIAFHHVSGTHDGVNLARTMLKLLDRAGIASKVCHLILIFKYVNMSSLPFKTGCFTLDNASNNATGMRELERLLINRGIDFDEDDNRVMYVT